MTGRCPAARPGTGQRAAGWRRWRWFRGNRAGVPAVRRAPGARRTSRSRGDVGLPRTSPWPLAGHYHTPQEQLAAPDAPGLGALERAGQAVSLPRAPTAQCLRVLHVIRRLGEEQIRVVGAGQPLAGRHPERGDRSRAGAIRRSRE